MFNHPTQKTHKKKNKKQIKAKKKKTNQKQKNKKQNKKQKTKPNQTKENKKQQKTTKNDVANLLMNYMQSSHMLVNCTYVCL